MSDFEKLIDRAYKHAQKKLHREGEVLPTWFVIDPDGVEIIKVTRWGEIDDRLAHTYAMGVVMREIKALRFILIAECWLGKPTGHIKDMMKESIADQPDREEVVIVIGEDTDGQRCTGWAQIQRNEGGRPRLGELQREAAVVLSHFSGLLLTGLPEQTRH